MAKRHPRPAAVADAGPLIHLAEAEASEALRVFRQAWVPEPVADELRQRPDAPAAQSLQQRLLRVVPLTAAEKDDAERFSLRYEVGLVDASVLAVARARRVDVVATDDLDLRDAAKLMGLQPAGTVGILLRAATADLLKVEDAERALDAVLTQSSLFVTRSLVQEAKAALRRPRA